MKRWGTQYRNFIILCFLVISLAALIFVTLQQNRSNYAFPSSAIQSPAPISHATATPIHNEASEIDLFQLVQDDKYHYFRVNENNQFWDYKPGQPIWYSQGDARFMLALDVAYPDRLTSKQLEMLRNNVALTTTTGEPVSFSIMEGNNEQQLIISLKGTPNSDLTLTFYSADQSQTKPLTIYYMKTFDYKIIAEHIPLIEKAFAFSKENMELPLSISTKTDHTFTFQFTDEIDRASVDEHFKKLLAEAIWSVDWIDNRTFNLKLKYENKPENPLVRLSASGIRNARGVELKSLNYVLLELTNIKGYGLYDLSSNTQLTWLETSNKYDSLALSPNDKWLLATTVLKTPTQTQYLYEILDMKGTALKQFDYNALYLPRWLTTDDQIISINARSGNRELVLYDPIKDSNELIWQVPDPNSQILTYAIEPKQNAIAIAWGKPNSLDVIDLQIDVLKGLQDSSPKRYMNLGKVVCNKKPCLYPLQWVNENHLVFKTNEGNLMLNHKLEQARVLAKPLVQSKFSLLEVVPYRSKNWAVSMHEENGIEQWIWSDGEQDITFTTQLDIPDNVKLLQGPYGVGSAVYFYVEGKGWFQLDPGAKTARLTNDVLESLNPGLIIGQHKEKLIIGIE